MVSNQKTSIKRTLNSNTTSKPDNVYNLEKEIKHVLYICNDFGKYNNNTSVRNGPHEKDQKSKNNQEPAKKNAEVTLEKVAQDMSFILKDLKDHVHTFKEKHDSFSDMVPKLEESLQNSNKGKKKIDDKRIKTKYQNDKNYVTCNTQPVPEPATDSNQRFSKSKTNKSKHTTNRKISTGNLAPKHQSKTNFNKSKFSNHSNNNSLRNNSKLSLNSISKSYKSGSMVQSVLSIDTKTSITSRHGNFATIKRHSYNPLTNIQAEVQKAVAKKKVFTIKGNYPGVRQALLKRGWIEKLNPSYIRAQEKYRNFYTYSIPQLANLLWRQDIAENCKKIIMSKLLQKYQVDFYWSHNWDVFKECPDNIKLTKVNRFKKDLFCYTSKLGLCDANEKAVWFKFPGVSNFNHPRTYSLAKTGDTPGFIRDFNRTAAMSLLKWVVKNSITGEFKVLSPSGKVPIEVFDFAVNECYKFIKKAEHEDIDNEIKEAFDYEWNEFLEYFYKTVHIGNHFKQSGEVTEKDMVRKANFILNKLSNHWRYLQMDGVMNIWILKPITGSQGIGIHCCRTLQYILKTIKANPNRRYIIQKYIERPLLIYETKFDIRQWFLISSSDPLTIWMYKQCYIRFSSQTYNLRKLHESIHLTNNSVQARYQKTDRDIALPHYNMWDTLGFKNYLSNIGYADVFNKVIYPGMKECIIAAVLMYQDKLDRRKNSFELYGADFMLTEDFKPWLLEINSNPALYNSTPVTAKLCPAVLEDTIKVVIDFQENRLASTGDFELIYKNHLPKEIANMKFQVNGTPLTYDYFYNAPLNEFKQFNEEDVTQRVLRTDAADYVKYIGSGMKKTLENLLEILKKEKHKRHESQNKSVTTFLSLATETKECQTDCPLESKEMLPIQRSKFMSICKKCYTEKIITESNSIINEKISNTQSNKSLEVGKVKLKKNEIVGTKSETESI